VLVTVSAGDFQSGIAELRYTTDDTDPGPDHGTVIAPGGTFSVTTPDAFVIVWGVDRVGNAGTFAEASVAGAPGPSAQNGNILYQSTRPDPADDSLSHIWEVDPATGAETQLEPPNPALHVAVSNDGTRLAWQATSRNGSFIAVGGRDGTNPVAFTGGNDDWPAFSPDGTRIAYAHLEASGVHDIYIKSTDGGDAVNVTSTSETDEIQPSWSPDGTSSSTRRRRTRGLGRRRAGRICRRRQAESHCRQPGRRRRPAWSPDGTQIAFDSNSGTRGARCG
jgi:hypothetical protein